MSRTTYYIWQGSLVLNTNKLLAALYQVFSYTLLKICLRARSWIPAKSSVLDLEGETFDCVLNILQ